MLIATLLLLLLIANAVPLLAGHWLHTKRLGAIDCGHLCRDGERLLGKSKTWKGVLSAVLATAIAALILNFPLLPAAILAAAAMLGDLLSSFVKRRLHYRSGINVPGLDQLPESLLPMLILSLFIPLTYTQLLLPVLLFILLHIIFTECLSLLHWHPKRCQ